MPTARLASGDKAIDQCRLSDAGMSDQGGQLVLEDLRQFVQGIVATGDDHLDVERSAKVLANSSGGSRSLLVKADDRRQATHVGGDQCALDEAGARWGIGECHDDEKLLRVRATTIRSKGSVSVGGPSQNRRTLGDPDDARQGVGFARQIADYVHLIADDDGGFGQVRGRAS